MMPRGPLTRGAGKSRLHPATGRRKTVLARYGSRSANFHKCWAIPGYPSRLPRSSRPGRWPGPSGTCCNGGLTAPRSGRWGSGPCCRAWLFTRSPLCTSATVASRSTWCGLRLSQIGGAPTTRFALTILVAASGDTDLAGQLASAWDQAAPAGPGQWVLPSPYGPPQVITERGDAIAISSTRLQTIPVPVLAQAAASLSLATVDAIMAVWHKDRKPVKN